MLIQSDVMGLVDLRVDSAGPAFDPCGEAGEASERASFPSARSRSSRKEAEFLRIYVVVSASQ